MITLQLHQTENSQQRVDAEKIKNVITSTIFNKGQIELFTGEVTGDSDFNCSLRIVDDENENDTSYVIRNKSKTLDVFIYDNMFSFTGLKSGLIFNKLSRILKSISSDSKSNLWIFNITFPIGEMKTILSEYGIKNDNGNHWSGMLHINDIDSFVKSFELYFKVK